MGPPHVHNAVLGESGKTAYATLTMGQFNVGYAEHVAIGSASDITTQKAIAPYLPIAK